MGADDDTPDRESHHFGRSRGREDVDHGGDENQASDLENSANEEH
jgi:hypothetical protein